MNRKQFQILVFFAACKVCGLSKSEAVIQFVHTDLCRSLGDDLTVGDVHTFTEIIWY